MEKVQAENAGRAPQARWALQESGKRNASVIAKTAAMLITIHREAFQHMIAGGDAADEDSDSGAVAVSSTRFNRKIQWLRSKVNREAGRSAMQQRNLEQPDDSGRQLHTRLNLKDNFCASENSRTDVAYATVAEPQRLLERAMTARVTMKTWCDLHGMAPVAFVTMPIPEPLQELQVCAPDCSPAARLPLCIDYSCSVVDAELA